MGYIRRNVCVPLPRVKSLDELNAKLLAKCTQYLNHQIEGRPDKVGVMLNEDQAALQPMPRYTPDISKKVYPTVGRYSTVLFETNHYSVPCKYRGKATTVKAYPNHIEVWIEGTMVARHDRLFGRKEESLDLQHYLPILAQKGRAIRYARPVQNAVPAQFIDWLECPGTYSQGDRGNADPVSGSRLHCCYGRDRVCERTAGNSGCRYRSSCGSRGV